MRAVTVAVLLLACACAVIARAQQPPYTSKYDNVDVDKILGSKRLVNNYVACLTDKKPCSPEGTELKKVLPDAIKTRCAKCTEMQKDKAIKVVRKLQKEYPNEWKTVSEKWDPTGKLTKEFEEEMDKRKQG